MGGHSHMGASIKCIRKIFGILDPLPPSHYNTHATYQYYRLLLGKSAPSLHSGRHLWIVPRRKEARERGGRKFETLLRQKQSRAVLLRLRSGLVGCRLQFPKGIDFCPIYRFPYESVLGRAPLRHPSESEMPLLGTFSTTHINSQFREVQEIPE